jgi:hypothetical protein
MSGYRPSRRGATATIDVDFQGHAKVGNDLNLTGQGEDDPTATWLTVQEWTNKSLLSRF